MGPSYEPLLADERASFDGKPSGMRERFTPAMLADVDRSQVDLVHEFAVDYADDYYRVNYFVDPASHDDFPDDTDCTAVLYSLILDYGYTAHSLANVALDDMLTNVNSDGIVKTYWASPDDDRARIIDPVVCANVLYLATQLSRTPELGPTLFYLRDVLVSGEWHKGSRYYHSPDTLLWRLARSVPKERCPMTALVVDAITSRVGSSDNVFDASQRVLAAHRYGLVFESDANLVLGTNTPAVDSLIRLGRSGTYLQAHDLVKATHAAAVRCLITDATALAEQS